MFLDKVMLQFEPAGCHFGEMKNEQEKSSDPSDPDTDGSSDQGIRSKDKEYLYFALWQTRHCSLGGWVGFSGDCLPGPWHAAQPASVLMPLCRASDGIGGTFLLEETRNKSSSTTRTKTARPMVFFMSVDPRVDHHN